MSSTVASLDLRKEEIMILENIKRLCAARGITIAELERNAGVGNGVVARWDSMNPRTDRLKAVADYFGVRVDDLLREGDRQ